MALRISTAHGDKSEGVHKDDETQLPNGEPELGLAKIPHSKDIGDTKTESTSRSLEIGENWGWNHANPYVKMQAEMTAAEGMSSRQYVRIKSKAVISKGTRIASNKKKFHPIMKAQALSTQTSAC